MNSLVEYNLCGNHSVWQQLISDATNNRIAHAYLFAGPAGIGKATTAKTYIKYILRADKVLESRIDKNEFSDLLYISKADKSEITIDSIRMAYNFFNQTAGEGKYKFVIIDDAETLNGNASNALLKILEEPKPNTYIFLISNAAYNLIATIRSRCRIIKFSPLTVNQLQSLPVDINKYSELQDFIAGSPGKIELCEELDALSLFNKLNGLIQDLDILEFNKFTANLAKNDKQWNLVKSLLIFIICQNIKNSTKKNEALINSFDYIHKIFQEEDVYNLERKQVLLIALQEIRKNS